MPYIFTTATTIIISCVGKCHWWCKTATDPHPQSHTPLSNHPKVSYSKLDSTGRDVRLLQRSRFYATPLHAPNNTLNLLPSTCSQPLPLFPELSSSLHHSSCLLPHMLRHNVRPTSVATQSVQFTLLFFGSFN